MYSKLRASYSGVNRYTTVVRSHSKVCRWWKNSRAPHVWQVIFLVSYDSPQTSWETVGNPPDPHWKSQQNLPSCLPLKQGRPHRTSEPCSRTVSLPWCTHRWPGTASLLDHMDRHKDKRGRVEDRVIWCRTEKNMQRANQDPESHVQVTESQSVWVKTESKWGSIKIGQRPSYHRDSKTK